MPAAGGFENTGVAAGLNKGHVVTRFTGSDGLTLKNSKPKHRKGNPVPKRVQFTRDIIREVMGFAPYEKRAMEVLKLGKEKRAQRFCKKRLGTHQRGVQKKNQMTEAIRLMRR